MSAARTFGFPLALTVALLLVTPDGRACTNFLVTRGASSDGSTFITYAADAHDFYGELQYTPSGRHLAGAVREIIEWDSGKKLHEIPQPPVTYTVVGNMNEHQVSIGETTFGGREELRNKGGKIDYGSLMYIALERAKTAREAIQVMTDLVAEHGYYSGGESFSVADPKEVWLLEMVGTGEKGTGALWVARRVPDGFITAHANQARIRQFPLKDKDECLYEPRVIQFARDKGWFKGEDKDFSFADAYAPLDYKAWRICEARVWSMFRRAAPSKKGTWPSDFVTGVPSEERLPLWIKPDEELTVRDVMELMRDHFEDSPLDLNKGVGAGPFECPYRWRPLYWKVDEVEYTNERATSTQQTAFSFVAQMRKWLPDPVGGVLWFGVDDTFSSVYVPMYAGIRHAPYSYRQGTGGFERFDWDAAFWVFNVVSNWAYTRYNMMIKDIQLVQRELEGDFIASQPEIDAAAVALYKKSPGLARDYLTDYSDRQSARVIKRWQRLAMELFMRYMDGNVRDSQGEVTHPPLPKAWYQHIIKDSGDLYKIRGQEKKDKE